MPHADRDGIKTQSGDRAEMGVSHSGAVYIEPRPAPEGVDVRFFTRLGGVSKTPFDSLNVSRKMGDTAEAVDENLARIRSAMGGYPVAWVDQVAGKDVVEVEAGGFSGVADGLFTSRENLSLAIGVADCAPVALVAGDVVAMVHSGWRGTLAGISGEAARGMVQPSGGAPAAYIGPCIRRCCYEVSQEIADDFAREFGEEVVSGRRLDIAEAIAVDLRRAGVGDIVDTGLCTGCRGDLFFSHRTQKPKTGRNLCVIARPSGGGGT
ncbi:polyphenol oxidase family protein [Rubrobacter indicoceani]|uniref:polyphenol oxidase family protein n=1 Tax=Rubrobacter indicoceani TaxID=2051957 RepID=UPI001F08F726|nr:polyphenol oxidase family protein [Rubrobacter indicoceani]